MLNVVCKSPFSEETLPWLCRGSKPKIGDVVRVATYAPCETPHVACVSCCDTMRVDSIVHVQGNKVALRDPETNKLIGAVFKVEDPRELQRYHDANVINEEMNDLLRDAAAGRWETSTAKHADFLCGVDATTRQMVETQGPMTTWIRSTHEVKDTFLEWARVFVCMKNEPPRQRRIMEMFIFPLVRAVTGGKIQNKRCNEITPSQRVNWGKLPQSIELKFSEEMFHLAGFVYTRDGPRRIDDGGQQQQQQFHGGGGGASARAHEFLRQVAEMSGSERHWLLEELRREVGGGGGRPAPSAACLCVPPPLLILEGVLHPMPPGMNPLMFPPPMNISF